MDLEKRYQELLAKKSKARLDSKEFKEFKELAKKFGASSNKQPVFKPGNDFSWWNKYPELMNDVANLRSNWIAGTKLTDRLYAPGVMLVKMLNSYGHEHDVTGPINLAARNLFLKMFQKYRGITAYEASDLGITFIATLEVFMLIAKLERIYGIINNYDVLNRNYPTTLTEALNISDAQADWLRKNLSNYRYALNSLILKAQRILLPKDMSILANKLSLYGYVYKDHESSERAQAIMFDYNDYGYFNETKLTTGGCIEFKEKSMDDLIDFWGSGDNMFPVLNEMIDALLTSESVIKQYGDLLAYFGQEQMVTLLPLPAEYKIVPIYSEEILHKLHNSESVCGGNATAPNLKLFTRVDQNMESDDQSAITSYDNYTIYQYRGVIVTSGTLAPQGTTATGWASDMSSPSAQFLYKFCTNLYAIGSDTFPTDGHVLDTYRSDLTNETVCEGVLWKVNMRKSTPEENKHFHYVDSCAFEIIKEYDVCTYLGQPDALQIDHCQSITNVTTKRDTSVRKFSWFDWCPLVLYGNGSYIQEIAGDIDNARMISDIDVFRLHNCCVLSGFRSDISVRIGSTPNS